MLRSWGVSGSNSRYVGLIQPPILASIAYLDTNASIRKLGAWRIHLIWCTWRFLNHNTELSLTIYIWTTDTVFRTLSRHPSNCILLGRASLFPCTLQIASSSTACYFVALFSCYSIKLPIYLLIYASVYTPQLHFINMEPMASQVRKHYSQKNWEAHLEWALARAFKKTANFHCQSNISTSNLSV